MDAAVPPTQHCLTCLGIVTCVRTCSTIERSCGGGARLGRGIRRCCSVCHTSCAY
ncbi:hypothetical protein ANCDUO_22431 [Ancylostoma duodenale]|uniref:Uncharacterized protein n=1 Tax=Ancylostoma duodenale TaxID=51022 RepID=A0A0C2FFW5_9BILA|nr:hypothetical protein ANCDUO_22431 [Ancylostoma duodenale]